MVDADLPTPDLVTLEMLLEIIEENDILTRESASDVTVSQWQTFLGNAELVRHHIPNLQFNPRYDPNWTNARMVIRGVRSQIVAAIKRLKHEMEAQKQSKDQPPIGEQIDHWREECRWTQEQLADATGFDPTTVARHISRKMTPSIRSLGKYDNAFSKKLNQKIVILKTPGKRQ